MQKSQLDLYPAVPEDLKYVWERVVGRNTVGALVAELQDERIRIALLTFSSDEDKYEVIVEYPFECALQFEPESQCPNTPSTRVNGVTVEVLERSEDLSYVRRYIGNSLYFAYKTFCMHTY